MERCEMGDEYGASFFGALAIGVLFSLIAAYATAICISGCQMRWRRIRFERAANNQTGMGPDLPRYDPPSPITSGASIDRESPGSDDFMAVRGAKVVRLNDGTGSHAGSLISVDALQTPLSGSLMIMEDYWRSNQAYERLQIGDRESQDGYRTDVSEGSGSADSVAVEEKKLEPTVLTSDYGPGMFRPEGLHMRLAYGESLSDVEEEPGHSLTSTESVPCFDENWERLVGEYRAYLVGEGATFPERYESDREASRKSSAQYKGY